MQARRSGILLPHDLLDGQDAYVSILSPKTRRVVRHQQAKVGQREVVCYLDALYRNAPPDQLLFGMSARAFRTWWDLVFCLVGFDASTLAGGFTPTCLRGSGDTALYRAGVDLRSIAWLGRWTWHGWADGHGSTCSSATSKKSPRRRQCCRFQKVAARGFRPWRLQRRRYCE